MKKVSWKVFIKNYIELIMIMLLAYIVLGPSENTSFPFFMIISIPITAFMLFTGLDEKLKKVLP
ncbi:hypothetical protein [Bacillus sp. B1-b2]|uniref:hypothetical protein n=1 Tax=Bacillus sp. B1-b2 TaxID=2653201 RepID=UPI0012619548|nr:hypothetical protein [Bacillus sp. B1-b2]KAB7667169.1 hypothetical protein F9279_16385 [Bacillus sp. B1-b2]